MSPTDGGISHDLNKDIEELGPGGKAERDAIDARREFFKRPSLASGDGLAGLALSGGGMRATAFCLGALQALGATESAVLPAGSRRNGTASALDHVDIVSSVSGGGYIAAATVAGMTRISQFPFESILGEEELPALQHVRDHANYLLPRGFLDGLVTLAVYLRGLLAAGIHVLAFLLAFAALAIALNREISDGTSLWAKHPINVFHVDYFVITVDLIALLAILFGVWALARSLSDRSMPDVSGPWPRVFVVALAALLVVAFSDLHPLIFRAMTSAPAETAETAEGGGLWGLVNRVAAVLSPMVAVVAFLARRLGKVVASASTGIRSILAKLGAIALLVAAAAVLPVLLWVAFLNLSLLGLPQGSSLPWAPAWLDAPARWLFGEAWWRVAGLYGVAAVVLFALSFLMKPNANSLHRLYRDRLSKAFLFDPGKPANKDEPHGERWPLDPLKLSEARNSRAPYPIVNATLNLYGSSFANRRGRNGDFFVFTPDYFGSEATGYTAAEQMEAHDPSIDYAAAMAVSGAAASANMGALTVRLLVPTLTLLNIRLGYWLRNPRDVRQDGKARRPVSTGFYLLKELLSRLSPTDPHVYLTDGGHQENLGLYQLLRRKCRLIVVVDAEADPDFTFAALARAERHARLDLGVRLFVPVAALRAAILARSPTPGGPDAAGPAVHCALGRIEYPGTKSIDPGHILYVKASVGGDEAGYILDYRRRYPAFPHESTADQIFSEEQFEAYRALGFHCLHGVLKRRDHVAIDADVTAAGQPLSAPTVRGADPGEIVPSADPRLDAMLARLGVPATGGRVEPTGERRQARRRSSAPPRNEGPSG